MAKYRILRLDAIATPYPIDATVAWIRTMRQ